MQNKIQRLPEHIANQIAAGEVIQRPASVIKELMENSIDAGSTHVEVNITDAGKSMIQIIDNGVGMSSTDAVTCFERHATSKISKVEDLFDLTTKGFRGEALASIAAIAHVELRTKRAEDETGRLVRIEGSQVKINEETVCPNGTQFEIKNLFYNVPARRNFLKSDKIEFSHITDEFLRVALAHPSISFKLSHNGTVLYDLRDAVLRRRIVDVLGKNSNDRLVPIEETTDIVELHGFVLKPEFSKKTRGEQYFFVNDRFFKSSYFNHAITKAYEGLLKEGYFPSFFVYLKVSNHKIDVNVHPTKTEIKFEEEKFIYSILLSSIRQALGKFNISPTLDFDRESSFDLPLSMRDQPVTEPKIAVNPDFNPFRSESSRASQGVGNGFTTAIKNAGFGKDLNFDQKDWASFYEIKEEKPNDPIKLDLNTDTNLDFIVKGNYVFIPSQLGITVINARRAYELIVHSELFKNFIVKPLDSQILLFPISIELSRTQETLWMDNELLLRQMGFSFSLSNGDLQIEGVPEILQDETIQPCIEEILQTLEFEDITVRDLAQSVLINIARSSAMKRMDLQNKEYTRQLIVRLYELGEFETTLDGRKVVSSISLEELGNKFN